MSDKVEEPVAVAGLGEKLALTLDGRPLMLKVTELDPPTDARLIVSAPVDPREIVRLGNEAEMVKSGGGGGGGADTMTEKAVECVRPPPCPVMVLFIYVPACVPAGTVTVKLDVGNAGLTEVGLREHVIGAQFVLRATEELNPLSGVIVTVAGEPEFDAPAASVIGDGLSERPKSGLPAAPHWLNLKDPMKVYQL